MRKGRFIGGNKGCEGPRNIITVTTIARSHDVPGTVPTRMDTLLHWCASRVRLEGNRETRRSDASGSAAGEFWRFVDKHSDASRRTWIFSPDVGRDFTLLGGWIELDSGRLSLEPMYKRDKKGRETQERSWSPKLVIDGQVTFIVCRNGLKTYTIVDTGNYWPRREWEDKRGKDREGPASEVAGRGDCKRTADTRRTCDNVLDAVVGLVRRWIIEDCGVFQPTAASLALHHWQHTCPIRSPDGRSPDVVCLPDHPSHKIERAAYYGGRIQPYKLGTLVGRVHHLDVNSLYPFVMHEHTYPRRYSHAEQGPTVGKVADAIGVYGVVGIARIETRDDTYPVRIDGRQFHCRGRFWTVLAGPELRRAIDRKHVVRFGRVQYYSLAPLFRSWVEYWFGRRLRAMQSCPPDVGDSEFCSTVLKALSGKFAQHGRQWEPLPGRIPLERWGGWVGPPPSTIDDAVGCFDEPKGSDLPGDRMDPRWCQYRGVAGLTQVLTSDLEPRHAFPAITAYITSHAREYIYGIIEKLPPGSVYYSATDSLFVSDAGCRAMRRLGLVHPTDLGKFKVKGVHQSGEIYGANYYELDGEITAAGWATGPPRPVGDSDLCEVREGLPGVVSRGPVANVKVQTLPVGPYRPDRKGVIDRTGKWFPYFIDDSSEYGDRPKPGGYDIDEFNRFCVWDQS